MARPGAEMYPSVAAAFASFSSPFEGKVPFMYLDVKGLVTIGIGNLIDPIEVALKIPFVHKADQSPATSAEVSAEWTLVKSRKDLAPRGGMIFGTITKLEITDASLTSLMTAKLTTMQASLTAGTPEFAAFESWPADAQLALLSMSWAMGPAFAQGGRWPSFRAACAAANWDSAQTNCAMDEQGNPGLHPRNLANAALFGNAAVVAAQGFAPDVLHYPTCLQSAPPAPAG